ncbi:hypothetical protein [Shewanella algae]|uniref:hypothetical protein n=1 Tax=Shewanella algae TaxID=38313 RepID=UPI002659EB3E|nr:hypothetical protein [Shewanella algae]WKC40174.1 hypothetical protein QYM03_12225 [Shewanella algae]
MRFIICTILTILLVVGAQGSDLQKITPWLLGASFTISIFSINFTFFGYQLSKYKAIYDRISTRQWFNLGSLLVLPFIPLISYLFYPDSFGFIALGILPLLALSSWDNAALTTKYLDASQFIANSTEKNVIDKYLHSIELEIKKEVTTHKSYLNNKDKFQIPMHGYSFEPTMLGLEPDDIWDSITIVTNLAIENNDYPTFRKAISAVFKVLMQSYAYSSSDDEHQVDSGVRFIARKRFRGIIKHVIENDSNGIFLQSLSGELCEALLDSELINKPCSEVTRAVASEAVWIGSNMLEFKTITEPLKVLNSIQRVIEINLQRLENSDTSKFEDQMDRINIAAYAHDIKSLGVSALNSNNTHFAYRCMESLSYLGCNAAKLKSTDTVTAVFESIVHLGRMSRKLEIGCFWSRCLIPAESHAEEFLGHILTWLVVDIDSSGKFFMKDHTEQAYSRLRGVKCIVKPKNKLNPIFWIEELKENDKTIPHIESQSGMYGYGGNLDYSEFSNLKEYTLHGIGSESSSTMFYSEPIPLNLSDGNKDTHN